VITILVQFKTVSKPKIYSACNLVNVRNVYNLREKCIFTFEETFARRFSFDRLVHF